MKLHKKAFTLAEAVTVLAILGTVAVITIPTVFHNVRESGNITRLSKAAALYESVIRTISADRKISNINNLTAEGEDNNCNNIRRYFNIIDGGDCQFKSAEGIWWDMSNPGKVLVAFERADLDNDIASDEANNNAFYFTTAFDRNRTLRINDSAYANAMHNETDISDISKVYSFLNKRKRH